MADDKKAVKAEAKETKVVAKTDKKEQKATKSAAKKADPTKPSALWDIVIHPSLSEKSIVNVEAQNKVVFIVKRQATKPQVKKAVEEAFGVKVVKVNMLVTPKGKKRAYVRLAPEHLALDVATKLGMM